MEAESVQEVVKKLSANVASSASAADAEPLLKELHDALFSAENESTSESLPSLQRRVEALLSEINFKEVRRRANDTEKPPKHKRPPVSEELVVLECVLLLAHLLISSACGADTAASAIRPHHLKRLDTLVLPTLFSSTCVSPTQLREVALRRPWSILCERAEKAKSLVDVLSEDMQDYFSALKANYHCDFLPRGRSEATRAALTVPSTTTTTQTAAAFDCLSWADGVQQQQPHAWVPRPQAGGASGCSGRLPLSLRNGGGGSAHGIPAYLLTKRTANVAVRAAERPALKRQVEPEEDDAQAESAHPPTEHIGDSEDSNSLLALETPALCATTLAKMDMRGLAHFISDVRKATGNRREEENRVEEELAKIRAKFIDAGHMSTYDRKKYVCKLMFISMLGYPITFGHMEGIKLMAEKTPAEKLIGYLSATVLLNENSELMTLTTHTVYRDLLSGEDLNRGLALSIIANSGGKDFAEVMHEGIQQIILNDNVDQHVRKKALLTLLRVHQRYPGVAELAAVVPTAVDLLLCNQDGVSMCAVEFLSGCINKANEHLFVGVPAKLIELLSRIIIEKQTEPGYVYYGVPAPWLQCKVLRFLQYFPVPSDTTLHDRAILILRKIIKATDKVLKDAQTQQKQRGAQNRVSVMNAVLFEVVSLAIQWEVGSKVILECVSVISNFISDKREANLRYIGLSLLSRLSFVKGVPEFDFQAQCKQYQQQIVVGLHDADVSIRRKALEVLVAMCNPANAADIIKELLTYLPIVPDNVFKGNLVLAIALLSEKYCDDSNMYVDILLTVVAQAGDICPPDVAYRVVHVIVNNPSVQKRATTFVFNALRTRKHVHDVLLQVAAFVLGEFGYQIALSAESTPQHQLTLLNAQADYADTVTQALILTAFFKFYNLYDDATVRSRIVDILTSYRTSVHPELQQRAIEYLALIEHGSMELVEKVLEAIPAFPDDVNIALERLRKMRNMHDIWADKLIAREGAKATGGDGKDGKDGTKKPTAKKQSAGGGTTNGGVSAPGKVIKLSDLYSAKTATAQTSASKASNSESAEIAQLNALFEASRPGNADAMRQAYRAHRQCFTNLLVTPRGVLFSDSSVEVRCERVFHLADGRLALTIVNKTGATLPGVSLELLGAEAGLLTQSRLSEEGRRARERGLEAGASIAVDVAARSLAPFHDPPSVRLQYGAGESAVVHTLSLPIVTACYVSAYDVDSRDDLLQLFDSVKRTTQAATRTLTAAKTHSKEAVLGILSQHGLRACLTDQGTVVGIGAHATQPKEKVNFAPVTCEVAQTSAATMLSVYAADPDVQRVLLDVLVLSL